jgi:tetratricopeptide (TPR) repeat protein
MGSKKNESIDFEQCSLHELCDLVNDYAVAFEDVAEFIEEKIYSLCSSDGDASPIAELTRLADFFELMPDKNEENCRDLANIYMLIGEVRQYVGQFPESIEWFKKAAIVFDRFAAPYHNLATSYGEMGDSLNAIKSLEQEITLEPGNYFSILRLVDFYEQSGQFDKAEEGLKKVLERDPDNIKALHKLIAYYEKRHPEAGVQLMRRRLIGVNKDFNEIEIVIRVFHLCMEKRFAEVIDFLNNRSAVSPNVSMVYLLLAHTYGELRQFTRKRKALVEFKKNCFGKMKFMGNKLEEFEHIFGKKAVTSIEKILMISNLR